MMTVLGLGMTIGGVLLLALSWRERRAGRHARRRVLVTSAWLVLVVSLLPWMIAGGTDRGVALAIIILMLAGLALIARAALAGEGNGRRANGRDVSSNGASNTGFGGWRLFLRRTWVFLLAGPVSAAAAVFLAAAAFAAWNVETGSAANRLAAVMLIVPIAWSLLAIWATYDVSLRRRSLVVLSVVAAGAAGTFIPGVA